MTGPIPRVLAFYRTEEGESDDGPRWRVIAWGLRHPDGWIAMVSLEEPHSVALWSSVEEAEIAMNAFVDIPEQTQGVRRG
jgi:hypothetical protein